MQNREENFLSITEKQLSRNEIVWHTIAVICVKGFLDSNFMQVLINIKFSQNCPIIHIFTKYRNFEVYDIWK